MRKIAIAIRLFPNGIVFAIKSESDNTSIANPWCKEFKKYVDNFSWKSKKKPTIQKSGPDFGEVKYKYIKKVSRNK